MKLLLDQNVSDRIVERIEDLFPGSAHVKSLGLHEAEDIALWEWAKRNDFTILSKDTDFQQRAIVFGHPPKFIWLRVGNCPTTLITSLLMIIDQLYEYVQAVPLPLTLYAIGGALALLLALGRCAARGIRVAW